MRLATRRCRSRRSARRNAHRTACQNDASHRVANRSERHVGVGRRRGAVAGGQHGRAECGHPARATVGDGCAVSTGPCGTRGSTFRAARAPGIDGSQGPRSERQYRTIAPVVDRPVRPIWALTVDRLAAGSGLFDRVAGAARVQRALRLRRCQGGPTRLASSSGLLDANGCVRRSGLARKSDDRLSARGATGTNDARRTATQVTSWCSRCPHSMSMWSPRTTRWAALVPVGTPT